MSFLRTFPLTLRGREGTRCTDLGARTTAQLPFPERDELLFRDGAVFIELDDGGDRLAPVRVR